MENDVPQISLWFCDYYKIDSGDYDDGRWQDIGPRYSETPITAGTWWSDGIRYGIFNPVKRDFSSLEEASAATIGFSPLYR